MKVDLCRNIDWLLSQEAFSIYAPCMYQSSFTDYISRMKNYISDPCIMIFICEENGKAAGILVLRRDGEESEIAGIAVSEGLRNGGIGRNMINQVMKQEKLSCIRAQTDDDSIGFYRKCGFSEERVCVEYPDGSRVRYNCSLNRSNEEEYVFNRVINGIEVCASYCREEIDNIFIPLLKHLSALRSQKKKRVLMMLAAPPGAGKSTLVSFLEHLSEELITDHKVQAIGMDGFHRRQEYLLSHTAKVNGNEVRMVDIKGAPVTFDLEALKGKIREVAAGDVCGWPAYNRLLHNPVNDAVIVDGDIVILEGNYLLLDEDGWRDLSDYADYTVSITADPGMLKTRLLARKIASGASNEEAERFVSFSDMANVKLCLEKTKKADLRLEVSEKSGYAILGRMRA